MKKWFLILVVVGSLICTHSIFAETEDELRIKITDARGAIMFGDYENAISICDEVLKQNPNYPRAYAARAHAKFSLENDSGALEDANKAIELSIEYGATNIDPAYYVKAALIFVDEEQSDLQPALELITKAITLSQFTPVSEYYELRSEIYKVMGDQEHADKDLAKMDEILMNK